LIEWRPDLDAPLDAGVDGLQRLGFDRR